MVTRTRTTLVAALALALAGGALLAAGLLDREMAHVEEHIAAGNYGEPAEILERLEPYYQYASLLPWIGDGPVNAVRARRAQLDYWRGRYGNLVPEQSDPVGAVPADNIALQEVVAHSVYRSGQTRAKDRDSALKALDAGIEAYHTVLRNAARHEQAAHNYEYLLRVRDEIEKGKRKPDLSAQKPEGALGSPGAVLEEGIPDQFNVLVPLTTGERDKAGAGKAPPIRRKG